MSEWFTYRYRDDLPMVPASLMMEALDSIRGQNIRELSDQYVQRNDPGEQNDCIRAYDKIPMLRKWFNATIKPLIKFDKPDQELFVQTIGPKVQIHKDPARRVVLNYIIDIGGERVITAHYNERKEMLFADVIEPFRWHELQTDIFHNVLHHTRDRVGLTFDLIKHYGPIENYQNEAFVEAYPCKVASWITPLMNKTL